MSNPEERRCPSCVHPVTFTVVEIVETFSSTVRNLSFGPAFCGYAGEAALLDNMKDERVCRCHHMAHEEYYAASLVGTRK